MGGKTRLDEAAAGMAGSGEARREGAARLRRSAGRVAALALGCGAGWLWGAGAVHAQGAPRPAPGDRLGDAVAFGDFNGDGRTDVAVSAPGARVSGQILIRVPPGTGAQDAKLSAENDPRAGRVLVYLGLRSGGFEPPRVLDQAMLGANTEGDQFGAALAAGDFDGDGMDDLAVGAPGKQDGGAAGAGVVYLFRGSAAGLVPLRALSQESDRLGQSEAGDRFGEALAVGDFTGDGRADLAVGAPGETVRGARAAGTVFLLRGERTAASGAPRLLSLLQVIEQELDGVSEANDRFGAALVAIDLDRDQRDDLAVGIPGDSRQGEPRGSGIVFMYRSEGNRVVPAGSIDQEAAGTARFTNAAGDAFGSALASADFNGDALPDLAVGAPGVGNDVGRVLIFLGSRTGLRLDRGVNGLAAAGSRYGATVSAGDYNGDRRGDLTVGAPGRTNGQGAVGMVFVLLSGREILEPRARINDSVDGRTGELGTAIASGDLNGDGRDDLAVGLPGANVGGGAAGRLLLLDGNAMGLQNPRDLAPVR